MKKILIFLIIFLGVGVNQTFASDFILSGSTLEQDETYSKSTSSIKGQYITPDKDFIFIQENNVLRKYEIVTPGDLSTINSTAVQTKSFTYYMNGITFDSNGDYYYGIDYFRKRLYRYACSTSWDLSTCISSQYFVITTPGTSIPWSGIHISDDGTKLIFVYDDSNTGYINKLSYYSLSTPFDLTSKSLIDDVNLGGTNYYNSLHIDSTYANLVVSNISSRTLSNYTINDLDTLDLTFVDDFTTASFGDNQPTYYMSSDFSYFTVLDRIFTKILQYDTNSTTSSALSITSTGTVSTLQNGVLLEEFGVNNDYYVSYYISNITDDIEFEYISTDEQAFSGGLIDLYFYNDDDFQFTSLVDYKINLIITNYVDELDIILYDFDVYYTYNSGPIEPVEGDFSFLSSGITFFENGFALNNFVPTPSGGELYFEIIGPALTGTGTINITTNSLLPKEIDGFGYGYDTQVIITYPYHQVSGTYQVRTVYEYQDLELYPYGTDYNSYIITVAEVPGAGYDGVTDFLDDPEFGDCDIDDDGYVEWNEMLTCATNWTSNTISSIYKIILNFKEFFTTLMNIGNVGYEKLGFNLIPKTYANELTDAFKDKDPEQIDGFLGDTYVFFKYFLYFLFLVFILSMFMIIKNKE